MPPKDKPHLCEHCGEPFERKKVTFYYQRFCSPACRLRAWREARRDARSNNNRPRAKEVKDANVDWR